MTSALGDLNFVILYSVYKSVRFIDPYRTPKAVLVLQNFRFSDTCFIAAFKTFDKQIYPFKRFLILCQSI